MNSKNVKLINDCLKFSVSKDETRLNLNGIYFDPKGKKAVSTNGYIMTYSSYKYNAAFANKIVDFKNMSVIEREFLKYSAVIPNKFKEKVAVNITKDLIVKQKRPIIKAYYVKNEGFKLSDTPLDTFEFVINPEFLKPLVGNVLEMEYNSELNPIRFTLCSQDSYYIVMPIRV